MAEEKSFSTSWPMFRGGQRQLGVCDGSLPKELDLLWQYKTGGPIVSSAVIADGTVFIGSGDGFVYALDLGSGARVWTFKTGGSIEAPPMVLNDSVYIGSTDGFLYSLSASGGAQRWKFETSDQILGSANWAVLEGEKDPLIVFGSYDGYLYALDSRTGKERWRYESDNYINGSPAISNGQAVFGGCDAMIHCVSLKDGKQISVFDVGAYIAASIAFEGTRAYIGHYANQFLCVDIPNQKTVWEYEDREFPFFSSPAVGNDCVVFGARDSRVHCVNKKTGKRIWVFRTKGKWIHRPSYAAMMSWLDRATADYIASDWRMERYGGNTKSARGF